MVEATGADVETVGRMLAEIRQGVMGERIDSLLQNHESRLQTLEQGATYVAYPRPPTNPLYIPFNYPKTDVDPMSPSEVRRGRLHRSLIVIATVITLLVVMFVESCSK